MSGKVIYTSIVLLLALQSVSAQSQLMQADMEDALESAWHKKEVFDSLIIDDCESLENWESGGEANAALSNLLRKEGNSSIKLTTSTVSADGSASYPTSYLVRNINGADWTNFNRISVWVYAAHKNAAFVYLSMNLKNEGEERVPNKFKKKGRHFFKVETNRWNNVLWEIPSLPRDKVSSLAFVYTINGKTFSGLGDSIRVCFDKMALQKVEADHEEGWQVAPRKIAFSHTGYSTGGTKSALANMPDADEFSIINLHSGETVLTKRVENTSTRFGEFQLLDFSELRRDGEYMIRTGEITTPPFKIGNNIWTGTIWKNLNFWRAERCGQEVVGIHENCHRDVCVEHGNQKIVVNGGWHDAGDLTQMVYNTADAVYAMLDLAEKLRSRDTSLSRQLAEEARWGVDWILNTRFGKGWRHNFGGISKWTDGIIGTGDDIVFEAKNQPLENFLSASVLSRTALFFRNSDPALSTSCLLAAMEDWHYAGEGISKLDVELCGTAVLASTHLFELTGDDLYKNRAIEWATVLVNSQQQTYPDWDTPLTGFFYKSPDKKQVLRYNPIGNDQAPIVALDNMCRLFPDHEKWMDWYASIALYAEYTKRSAELSNPFQMIPQSIYNVDETHSPSRYGFQQSTLAKYAKYEKKEPQYKQQVLNGLPLGGGNFLRTFPVWYSHRGSAGIQLAQAKGLAVASHLRNDLEGINLAEKQLQWMVGRNPFVQSTMYGEGYDFPPLYFVSSGPIVGSIACGIQTNGNSDLPNWPASTVYNYKEIWTHTATRWLMLTADLNGAARVLVRGCSGDSLVKFTEKDTGEEWLTGGGSQDESQMEIPSGRYQIECGQRSMNMTFLPGSETSIDFNTLVTYTVFERFLKDGEIEFTLLCKGSGEAKVELRGFNLQIDSPVKSIQFKKEKLKKVRWKVRVDSPGKPWIALVVINDDLSTAKEVGSVY
ncbi:MAG: glycoside hydrolase family 9 protein [Bacteroidota bacterium]